MIAKHRWLPNKKRIKRQAPDCWWVDLTIVVDICRHAFYKINRGETSAGEGGGMMVSVWWALSAFVIGGSAGIALMALLSMARSQADIADGVFDRSRGITTATPPGDWSI